MIGLALFHLVHHLCVLQIDPSLQTPPQAKCRGQGSPRGKVPPLRLLFAGVDDRRDPVAGEVVQLPILHPSLQYVQCQCRMRASVLALRPFQLGQRSCLLGTRGSGETAAPAHAAGRGCGAAVRARENAYSRGSPKSHRKSPRVHQQLTPRGTCFR